MKVSRKRLAALPIAVVMVGMVAFLSFAAGARSQPVHGTWTQVGISALVPSCVHLTEVQLVDNTTAWLVGTGLVGPTIPSDGHVYKLKLDAGRWGLSER